MAWTTLLVEPLYMDPASIAKQFVKSAVATMQVARQREHEEWPADQREWARMQRSGAAKAAWARRKGLATAAAELEVDARTKRGLAGP